MSKAYSELVKDIGKIRDYIREFFIFGWRTRSDYDKDSGRTYDDIRRRIGNWLTPYIERKWVQDGQSVSIAVDAEDLPRNPLSEVWRTKSFTSNDISLHFFILDVLSDGALTVKETTDEINTRHGKVFDVYTMRTKLLEYEAEGLLFSSRKGKSLKYALSKTHCSDLPQSMQDAVAFFAETASFGEMGGHIQEEAAWHNKFFRFKHPFIVHTLESEVLLKILKAIEEKKRITLDMGKKSDISGVPLKILTGVQSGRRYVAMQRDDGIFFSQRLDKVKVVKIEETVPNYDDIKEEFLRELEFAWGVTFGTKDGNGDKNAPERVKVELCIDEKNEPNVLDRLKREVRHGKLHEKPENLYIYRCSVWNASEITPFIRSFTGHIVSFESNNQDVVKRFNEDTRRMYEMYCGKEADKNG